MIGGLFSSLFNNHDNLSSQVTYLLVSTTESHPMSGRGSPLPSTRYMMIVDDTSMQSGGKYNIQHNCGTLIVSLDDQGRLSLNKENIGSLNQIGKVKDRLKQLFQERISNRAYKVGMEMRKDVAEEERIVKEVIIEASARARWGEVVEVIEEVKSAGADPIVIQVRELAE
jgi:biopolymer transport protein ExbD